MHVNVMHRLTSVIVSVDDHAETAVHHALYLGDLLDSTEQMTESSSSGTLSAMLSK